MAKGKKGRSQRKDKGKSSVLAKFVRGEITAEQYFKQVGVKKK